MRVSLGNAVVELVKGDITHQKVDAIVNAANSRLRGGGGVDGAIHAAGGRAILEELTRNFPNGCATGDAVATTAGKLQAKFVIHAVGPRYDTRELDRCTELLARAYRNSLQVAAQRGCRSIALPAISTGIYSYPVPEAARIGLRTARDFLSTGSSLELVRWVLFDAGTYQDFVDAANQVFADLPREE